MGAESTPRPFAPDYVAPPGESLLEALEQLNISQSELAERTGRPKKTINEIIKGKAAITPETALQLERVLGVPAAFWTAREQYYRTALARLEERSRLAGHVDWLKRFPVRDMVKLEWLPALRDPVEQLEALLSFFGVVSPDTWRDVWADVRRAAVLRQAKPRAQAADQEVALAAVAAWLRQGEIEARRVAAELAPAAFDAGRLREALDAIRRLTAAADANAAFLEARDQCARAGVVLVLVHELPRARVCGAARWLSPTLALIQLSLYYHRDDQFWFSLFHEAGHVVLHGKRSVFVDAKRSSSAQEFATGTEEEEAEANRFAADLLIPPEQWAAFVAAGEFPHARIARFAESLGIAPSIVVGRLQREEWIHFSRCTEFFRRLDWGGD